MLETEPKHVCWLAREADTISDSTHTYLRFVSAEGEPAAAGMVYPVHTKPHGAVRNEYQSARGDQVSA